MPQPVRTLLTAPRAAPRSLAQARGRRPTPGAPNAALAAQLRLAQQRGAAPFGGSTLRPPPASYYNAVEANLADEQKPASLLGQLKGAALNLIPGIAGFVKAGATDVAALYRIPADLITSGHLHGNEPLTVNTQGVPQVAPALGGGAAQHYFPASSGMLASMGRTAYRASHPQEAYRQYREASKKGEIVNMAIEDAANLSIFLGAAGKLAGAGGGAVVEGTTAAERAILPTAAGEGTTRAAGAAVAEDLAQAPRQVFQVTPEGVASRIRQVEPYANAAAEEGAPATMRYRGLARIANAVAPESSAAQRLTTTGNVLRKAANLGGEMANVPAWPYQVVRGGARSLYDLLDTAIQARGGEALPRASLTGVLGGLAERYPNLPLWRFSAEGLQTRQLEQQSQSRVRDQMREALATGRMSTQFGLSDAEGAAVLNSLDYPQMLNEVQGKVTPEQLSELLDTAYQGSPSGVRPTPESVQATWDYANRSLPPERLAAMDAVRARLLQQTDVQTQQALNMRPSMFSKKTGRQEYVAAGLNPEQLGADYLTSEMARLRREQERPRDIAQREWSAAEPATVRQERIANATDALAAELPAPLQDVGGVFRQGVAKGKASIRDAAARAEHRTTLTRLEAAVNEYRALGGDAPVERVKELADRVDQLTARANEIADYVANARARPGVKVPRGELGQLRTRAKEIGAEQAAQVKGEIDQMTGGSRPAIPGRADVGGEWDWYRSGQIDQATKSRLRREGWLTKAGEGDTPDNFAQTMSQVYGREMTVDEAIGRYVETIKRMWDEQSGKGDATAAQLAYEQNLHPEQVTAALRGGLADYTRVAAGTADQALTDMRNQYAQLTPDEQTSFNQTVDAMLADPNANLSDFSELLGSYLPGVDAATIERDLGNRVDVRDVVDWMRKGETTPALQVAADQVRKAAASELNARPVVGPKLSEIVAPTSKGNPWKRYTGTTSTGETTNPLSPAERLSRRAAVERDRANQMRAAQVRRRRAIDYRNEKIADLRTELGRSFQDRVVEDVNRPVISRIRGRIDRAAPTLGTVVGRNDSAELTGLVRRLATKYGAYDDVTSVLQGLKEDMRRAQQGEMTDAFGNVSVATVDLPAEIVGDALRQVLDAKGVILEGPDLTDFNDAVAKGTLLEDIDAVVTADSTTGRRLNTPYRVEQLVHDSNWNMPADTLTSIKADMEGYGKRREKTWRQVNNDYTAALPAPRRAWAMRQQRIVGALMNMAEQHPESRDVFLQMAEDTGTTLDDMMARGIDPEYLIGGGEPNRSSVAGGQFVGQRTRRGEKQRTTGLRAQSIKAYSRVAADDARKYALNIRDEAVMQSGMARRADQIPAVAEKMQQFADQHHGEIMPNEDIAVAAREAGYTTLGQRGVTPDTALLPERVVRQLDPTLPMWGPLRALRRGNQMWKQWILPFSTKWIAGNVIGNTLMSTFNAGVSPVELVRQLNRIRQDEGGFRNWWDNEGLSRAAPNELSNYGLTHTERQIWQDYTQEGARTAPGRFVQKWAGRSYALNEFVDNAVRSATFLAKRAEGASREAALASTLKALGDFTRMNPMERNYIRQAFPFYAWMRHSFQATLRLPIESPMRAAILYNIANIFADPDTKNDFLGRIGEVPILGGFLDIGNVSPWFDFGDNPLTSTNYSRGLSPFIKTPYSLLTGGQIGDPRSITRPGETAPIPHLLTDPRHALGEIGYVAAQNAPAPIKSIRDIALGPERRTGTGYAMSSTKPDYSRIALILRGLNLPSYTPQSGG